MSAFTSKSFWFGRKRVSLLRRRPCLVTWLPGSSVGVHRPAGTRTTGAEPGPPVLHQRDIFTEFERRTTKNILLSRDFIVRSYFRAIHSSSINMPCNTDSIPLKSLLSTERTTRPEGFIFSVEKCCPSMYAKNIDSHYSLAPFHTELWMWRMPFINITWPVVAWSFEWLIVTNNITTFFYFSFYLKYGHHQVWHWAFNIYGLLSQETTKMIHQHITDISENVSSYRLNIGIACVEQAYCIKQSTSGLFWYCRMGFRFIHH